jgi:hypothetical protein
MAVDVRPILRQLSTRVDGFFGDRVGRTLNIGVRCLSELWGRR